MEITGCDIFCVSHKKPIFLPALPYQLISPQIDSEKMAANQVIVPDEIYGHLFHGRILSEYTQLFWLADMLKSYEREKSIMIFQYRKFLSFRYGKRVSSNIPYAYACHPEEANFLFPTLPELQHLGERLFLGPKLKVRSIAHQYASCHLLEDFSAFIASLGAVPYFTAKRIMNFINCKILFPVPSLGVHRIDIFITHMELLRKVWQSFSENYYIHRSGYQRRVGGFLLERLHSFLLFEDIFEKKSIPVIHGQQIVVSDTENINPTV
jgi:hypothetical protein